MLSVHLPFIFYHPSPTIVKTIAFRHRGRIMSDAISQRAFVLTHCKDTTPQMLTSSLAFLNRS